MSGNRAWPSWAGVPPQFSTCVYAYNQFWWAYEAAAFTGFKFFAMRVDANLQGYRATGIPARDVSDWRVRQPPAKPEPALYSAVWLNPTGMGWVNQPNGPVETMRAPYDEMLARVKTVAEMYPDTTYTVVKVCAEVRTPPKPTLEVKEY